MKQALIPIAALFLSAGVFPLSSSAAEAGQPGLPPAVVPQGWGVNIHFAKASPAELARFGEAKWGLTRMDLTWRSVERKLGVYDFEAFDFLVDNMAKQGTRVLFILDYGNPLYDGAQEAAPHTDEGRAAFARFAAAAAGHFKGKGVLWEIWNEPNGNFWKPAPDASNYAALALLTAKAIREADPNAMIMGPASAYFPWEFFETIFNRGLLSHLDAVSVHPYRKGPPESVLSDFDRLRVVIARHTEPGKTPVPIVSSEWGYTSAQGYHTEEQQAQYLVRQWLANMAGGVNLSIFYDWRDDGNNPKEYEHRFGTVRQDLTPKPAFLAVKNVIAALNGYSFRHRLQGKTPEDWLLLFAKGDDIAIAAWSADPKASALDQTPQVKQVPPSDPAYAMIRRAAAVHYDPTVLVSATETSATIAVTVKNPEAQAADVTLTAGDITQQARLGAHEEVRLLFKAPVGKLHESGRLSIPAAATWNGEPVRGLPDIKLLSFAPKQRPV